jgi:phage tail-like protein
VEWSDQEIDLRFTEVSGLVVENEVIEYRDGASREYSKIKMPGMQKFSNITLKRGTFKGLSSFYDWYNTIALNQVERRDMTVKLLNEEHQPVVVWRIKNAFPVKVEATDLKADGNEVAIETMEVAHEGLQAEFL